MSRVQTAALCVALAAVPVGWQLNERHAAGEEAKRTRTRLLAVQNEGGTAQAELERLRASAGKLEQSIAQQNEAGARAAEAAQAFEAWKKKTRSQLTAADYRWADDSPFVRIPKAVLSQLSELTYNNPFSPPGVIKPYARELMGLTPAERQTVEDRLQRQVTDLQQGKEATLYEQHQPASMVFYFGWQLGEEADQRTTQILADVRSILGEERWPLIPARCKGDNYYQLNLTPSPEPRLTISVGADDKGAPNWKWTGDAGALATKGGYSVGIVGYQNGALSMFLPEGDPNRTPGAEDFGGNLSPDWRQRVVAWLQEQAAARLSKKEKP
jgi:hypothetical protein